MMLTEKDIRVKLKQGEDSFTQFKRQVDSAVGIAEEMIAFANSDGGYILIGVEENNKGEGIITGIQNTKMLNSFVSNASTEICVPPIYPKIQTLLIDDKTVVVLFIEEGLQKPYRSKSGKYLMKAGADKRAISQEELSRMLQESRFFHIEELPVRDAIIEIALDKSTFYFFFEKEYNEPLMDHLEKENQSLENILTNLNLARGNELNLVGLLFFSKQPQRFRPSFICKAVSFYGKEIEDTRYLSSEDINGTLETQYRNGMNFMKSNLLKTQNTETFNSIGKLEISEIALEEFFVNALIHRDYSNLGSIQLLIFTDRIEIINPGHLVNHLSIENIKSGNAIPRNPIMLSFASRILPYRGLGSGIRRGLKAHPNTDLINDTDNQKFKVTLWR
ncbi:MAG: RNA-binding domain-containing protein [Ferruginibacter sp.]